MQRRWVALEGGEHGLPAFHDIPVLGGVVLAFDVFLRMLEVLPLQLHRVDTPAVRQGDLRVHVTSRETSWRD